MPSAQRWVWEKPSKLLILAILLTMITIATPSCSATEAQNTTLSEVSSYNFTNGFYQVVKYQQDGETTWWIMYETEIPYLNISYTAPSDGYLDIYLDPIDGPFPYIELDNYWEINSFTYSRSLEHNESVYYLISPPLIFADYNSSRAIGMGTTLWELYNWPELSGLINYTFISTDEISFDLIYHPSNPRQDDEISLFTSSNAHILNITWEIKGIDLDWINNSQVLEINNLNEGEYTIRVTGFDEFNNSHSTEAMITIQPPVIDQTYFDISLYSINYPESITIGEIIQFKAIIDYSIPKITEVKCILSDPTYSVNYTENQFPLDGDGSSNFSHYIESTDSGVMEFILRLFYNDNGNWVELEDSRRTFSITVTEPVESNQLPGFNPLSLAVGLSLIIIIGYLKNQK